jgi:hypothetical protein
LNTGGLFGQPVHYDAARDGLALGDLNGDARPEAITLSIDGFVEVWGNRGDGTFDPAPLVLTGTGAMYEVEVGNFFGSPRLDLVVLDSYISPSTAIFYRNVTR